MNELTALVIDDEVPLTKSLAFALKQAEIGCLEAHDAQSGLKIAEAERPDIILLDVRLPDISGLEVLERLQATLPDIPVIMISAHSDTKDAVRAIKNGAADYLNKPFDVDELIMLIRENFERKRLETEVSYLRKKNTGSSGFIGEGAVMLDLREQISRVARSSVRTILLLGETGVGKAVVARDIHNRGGRGDSPFVEINCASLPEEMMEAELFGAEKGAYTSSVSKRLGLVEIADQGTLFLDEIGELPLKLQAKLLTFLESWTFRPLGSPREKHAEVRVIAATNRNLEECVREGSFRQDLFFRLNIIPIKIPRLAERGYDIWLLANYFAEMFSRKEGTRPITFSPAVRNILEEYAWPGNVRELKNLVERLTIIHPACEVSEDKLPLEMSGNGSEPAGTIEDTMAAAERKLVQKALADCKGRKGLAAEMLGISRHALKRRIQRLGLE